MLSKEKEVDSTSELIRYIDLLIPFLVNVKGVMDWTWRFFFILSHAQIVWVFLIAWSALIYIQPVYIKVVNCLFT